MCPQDACTIGQKIASITILLIFSAMAFQWFPHDTSTRAQKVTLIAFVWLLSNVRWLPWLLRLRDSRDSETPKTMRLQGITGNGNSRSPLSQTMNCNFAQNLLTGWHWLQFSSCVTSNKFFCCKSEIKENWKVIWQKPRESRSLGSLGVSGVSESWESRESRSLKL